MNGDVIFIWIVLIIEILFLFCIEYNKSWIEFNDIRYIVKDVFLYIYIIIDVIECFFYEYDRWIYRGKIIFI